MFRKTPTILIGFVCTVTALPAFAQLAEARFESIHLSKVVTAVPGGQLFEPAFIVKVTNLFNF